MSIKEIEPGLLKEFLSRANNCLHQQTAESLQASQAKGVKAKLLGLVEGDELLATAKVLFLPFKKIFHAVEIYFAPIFDEARPEVFSRFLEELLLYLKKDFRNIRFRIAPLIEEARISNDLVRRKNPLAEAYKRILLDQGFTELKLNYDEAAGIQAKYFYVKEFYDKSEEELRASFSTSCRNDMRKAKRFGVQVRFLKKGEEDIFNRMMQATIKRTGMPEFTVNYLHGEEFSIYGESMLVPLAYIDRHISLATLEGELSDLTKNFSELEAQQETKRIRSRKNELREAILAAERRIKQVNEFCDEHGDIVSLACSQFFITESDMIYLQSAAYQEGFIFSPVYAIHDLMFKLAFEKGVSRYNMFAVSNPFENTGADTDVLSFKENFKGEFIEFIGSYEKKLRLSRIQ